MLRALHLAERYQVPIYFDPGPQMGYVAPEVSRLVLASVDTLLFTKDEIPVVAERGLATAKP